MGNSISDIPLTKEIIYNKKNNNIIQKIEKNREIIIDDDIFNKILNISNEIFSEYNNLFLNEDFCSKFALIYEKKLLNLDIKLLKELYNDVNSNKTDEELTLMLQYNPSKDEKFIDYNNFFKDNLVENFWYKNIKINNALLKDKEKKYIDNIVASTKFYPKYIDKEHVNTLLSKINKINEDSEKLIEKVGGYIKSNFSGNIRLNNSNINEKKENNNSNLNVNNNSQPKENNSNLEINAENKKVNNSNLIVKAENKKVNINSKSNSKSNAQPKENNNNLELKAENKKGNKNSESNSESNSELNSKSKENNNNLELKAENKKLNTNSESKANISRTFQTSENKTNSESKANISRTFETSENKTNSQPKAENKKVNNKIQEIKNNSLLKPDIKKETNSNINASKVPYVTTQKQLEQKTNHIIAKNTVPDKIESSIENKTINKIIKYSIPKDFQLTSFCKNKHKCNLTKKELCKAISENLIIKNNIIAAILTIIPYKNSEGEYEGGICYKKFLNLDSCKVCLPDNYKSLIGEKFKHVLPNILEKADYLDKKICKDKDGFFYELTNEQKEILVKKIITIKELKNNPNIQYNLFYIELKSKLKNIYFENLNYLIEILDQLRRKLIFSNKMLNEISNKTKKIIDDTYNLTQYYYVHAIYSLINLDIKEEKKRSSEINPNLYNAALQRR